MKWWIVLLAALPAAFGVAAQPAEHAELRISRFVLGTWNSARSTIAPDREGAGWASILNCSSADGDAAKTRELGVTISANGKLVANNGSWACLISEFRERPLGIVDRGPGWQFSGECDEEAPANKMTKPYVGTVEYPPLRGRVNGSMEVRYAHGHGEFLPMLYIWRDVSPQPGSMSLYSSELIGPFVRCE